ncbi:MAG: hypothetical protein KDB21_08970 [Acidimicrobiales bacterium]|nr:hypothetical protein [Acidimicrobiales bacterium]
MRETRLEANWRCIVAELDAPRPARVERTLRAVGIPARMTRVVVATPGLRRAWWVAVGVVALLALGTADAVDRAGSFTFLLLAPLVPVLGVSLAYGPGADPAHEVTLAAPVRGVRLVLTRAAVVLLTATAVLTLVALLSEADAWVAVAWLLPAVAVTSAALAAATVLQPRRAAAAAAVVWIVAVVVARSAANDPLAAFGATGQLVALAVIPVALAIAIARRHRFDLLTVAP